MSFGHVELLTKRALLRCPFGTKSEKFFNQEISLSLFAGKNSYLGRVLLMSLIAECVIQNSSRGRGVSNFLVA